ncbi:helix-turn-helix domain-containing protein [Pseudoalteromonas sp. T1lg65]|uniref:helix-turn-helix domain-containing protein n=1 Tax=Pseudoalteromonas sp. T1lg65 TaxID=2077101 RepID=UPI003F7B2924
MDISEVSKKSGLPASTIRYYEEKGLIRSVGRQGLKRTFTNSVLERLALITLGRNAGFSLEELASMHTENRPTLIDRQRLIDKAKELDESIRQMTITRDGLLKAAVCPEESHLQCRKFQTLLAKKGKVRPKKVL